ncbi:phosphoenolpyruvate synthase [candidate division CPR3 bacterium 4484_211]|uniref:Phosphoenolpyruvate synthase n=1 Tax=candidate division CPR3 bacterium 4484_211 TaxID=1968527 RepID=A0A1W9NZ49_UNCC3|nr:MAG: phosphoenolpyruvate synthase [candidate division CPR3 bacterium 4484_211]
MQFVKWFKEINKKDLNEVGGKAANLGEMTQAGFPVPEGFCVTANAYFYFLKENKLTQKLKEILNPIEVENTNSLQKASANIKLLIIQSQIPPKIEKEITQAYKKLGARTKVAVRSSATAEDLPEASFAGQQETFLNISGPNQVAEAVKKCWASLFTARSIYYREQKKFDHFKVGVAVPVQKMIQSQMSGIEFTVDPISNNPKIITIEAIYGLGEGIVSGSITPDHYQVNKDSLEIVTKKIVPQDKMITQKGEVAVSRDWRKKQKISDQLIKELAKIGKALEKHYQFPQDIEWAIWKNKIYIVQTRPVTTLTQKPHEVPGTDFGVFDEKIILKGLGASPGVVSGKVKKLKSAKEISKIRKGEILVTTMTTPDFVPAMKKAAAIITDEGGTTCHAAIISRELGIPCIVGTEVATNTLASGETVTIDGQNGVVYTGDLAQQISGNQQVATNKEQIAASKTATKIYVNLAEPERAEEIAKLPVDGVGLLRAEFMIAGIGVHPKYLIKQGKQDQFIKELENGLRIFTKSFKPRPVIYRTTDFKTNEYRNLKGGDKYEEEEANPMLGMRGALRYIKDPQVFQLELEAIKKVRQYYKNLWLMIPFLRTVEELIEIKKVLAANNLYRSPSFKLFIMVETPASAILLERFIGVGIDGVSIGSNDLTQLILAADRDNPVLGSTLNETNPAVMEVIEKVIKECRKHRILCSICGQAPSVYPEFVQKLVEWGISSISVNPDAFYKVKQLVAKAEASMVQSR